MKTNTTEFGVLRRQFYNATLVDWRQVHSGLRILRVRSDQAPVPFQPGQYVTLGLGNWESCPNKPSDSVPARFLKRPYSISARILDPSRKLIDPTTEDELEIYVSLAPPCATPGLTPRLFQIKEGDRLYLDRQARGHYTLDKIGDADHLIFAATGTGETPHNAMIACLLASGHRGQILAVTGVRLEVDLAYRDVYQMLEKMYSNLNYVWLTTREPRNLDSNRTDFVGKQYLQTYFTSKAFDDVWLPCEIARRRAFVCGNADMIGLPTREMNGIRLFPQPTGLIEVLEARGLLLDEAHRPGTIFTETFW